MMPVLHMKIVFIKRKEIDERIPQKYNKMERRRENKKKT